MGLLVGHDDVDVVSAAPPLWTVAAKIRIGILNMPFIREYSEGELPEENKLVSPLRKSPIEIALHEAVHAVILRLDGLDIADVIENHDFAYTRLVEPQEYTVAALMAPEVYMKLNQIEFTVEFVLSDRNAVAECIRPEIVEDIRRKNCALLENTFQCPDVRAAIDVLSARMDEELRDHIQMHGDFIHEIIDPILKHTPRRSPHWDAPDDDSEIAQYEALIDFFVREYGRSRRTLLVVDEAHNLTPAILEELRLLSNVNSENDLALQVFLVGQPELRTKLEQPELEQFAQRVSVDFHLGTLKLEEARAYVRHRLTVAGGDSSLFDAEAIALVHGRAGGIPRLLNQLCDLALVYAFAEQQRTVDVQLLQHVLQDRKERGAIQLFGGRPTAWTKVSAAVSLSSERG